MIKPIGRAIKPPSQYLKTSAVIYWPSSERRAIAEIKRRHSEKVIRPTRAAKLRAQAARILSAAAAA